jgi:hypothetical protein
MTDVSPEDLYDDYKVAYSADGKRRFDICKYHNGKDNFYEVEWDLGKEWDYDTSTCFEAETLEEVITYMVKYCDVEERDIRDVTWAEIVAVNLAGDGTFSGYFLDPNFGQIKSQPPVGQVAWGSATDADIVENTLRSYNLVIQQADEEGTLLFVKEHQADWYNEPKFIVPHGQEVWDYTPNLYLEMALNNRDKKESLKVLNVTADEYALTWNNPEARILNQALAAGGKILYGEVKDFRERAHLAAVAEEEKARKLEAFYSIFWVFIGVIVAVALYYIFS